mmetsp:Transcript_131091/g.407705  ORF Transcript_131091/g.407705 Transcript_131091/m.407705 type:complete len:432 (-) Transcript_131091:753-2048(-)
MPPVVVVQRVGDVAEEAQPGDDGVYDEHVENVVHQAAPPEPFLRNKVDEHDHESGVGDHGERHLVALGELLLTPGVLVLPLAKYAAGYPQQEVDEGDDGGGQDGQRALRVTLVARQERDLPLVQEVADREADGDQHQHGQRGPHPQQVPLQARAAQLLPVDVPGVGCSDDLQLRVGLTEGRERLAGHEASSGRLAVCPPLPEARPLFQAVPHVLLPPEDHHRRAGGRELLRGVGGGLVDALLETHDSLSQHCLLLFGLRRAPAASSRLRHSAPLLDQEAPGSADLQHPLPVAAGVPADHNLHQLNALIALYGHRVLPKEVSDGRLVCHRRWQALHHDREVVWHDRQVVHLLDSPVLVLPVGNDAKAEEQDGHDTHGQDLCLVRLVWAEVARGEPPLADKVLGDGVPALEGFEAGRNVLVEGNVRQAGTTLA